MAHRKDYYQLLQISHHADPAIIKAAYYTHLKILRKHPDLGGSEEEAKLLNEAYETLSDEKKRREYDRKLLENVIPISSVHKEENPFNPSQEQRLATRVAFQQPLQFRQYPKGIWFESQFRDVSTRGACFRSVGKFKEGDLVELEMSKAPHVWAVGKVRWARLLPQRFGSPLHEGGVEFQQIDVKAFQSYLTAFGLDHLF